MMAGPSAAIRSSDMKRVQSRALGWCALAVGIVALGGCSMLELRKDVTRLEEMGLVGGAVSGAQPDGAPIIVLLSSTAPAEVLDSFLLERPGSFFFVVPAGTYRIAAFVDRNRDFAYQPGAEPAAYYGEPADVQVAAGQKIGHLNLHIAAEPTARIEVPSAIPHLGSRGSAEMPPVHLGEVVTFDDPRFTPENGNRGLWQPVEFLFDIGAGFYFLEPFDPDKIPVLFVHGAGGQPGDWRTLVGGLDRKKFQPWLLYYPSGMHLDVMARGVARWLSTLALRLEVERLIVVAHSMGGLVSRAAINLMAANGDGGLVISFVSISSPWNGYGAAAAGVEHSPVVMPMWTDMAPGSPFLSSLFQTPLPAQCPYHLLFSYSGNSLLLREANDSVVTLSSELAPEAQAEAVKVYGFNETHMSILESAAVSRTPERHPRRSCRFTALKRAPPRFTPVLFCLIHDRPNFSLVGVL